MKKVALLLFLLATLFGTFAAGQYPPEWIQYVSDSYMYDIQSGKNDGNMSETDFKNHLLDMARTNLARQFEVGVRDAAELNKKSVDGRTSITYSSQTSFSTDINLKFAESKTAYDPVSGTGYAIAYIDRNAARDYYKNELDVICRKIDNAVASAGDYVDAGFNSKARAELEASLMQFGSADSSLLWLNIFGASGFELAGWQERLNTAERNIKKLLSKLQHATVIYLSCKADLFGKPYPALQNRLKGVLSKEGCGFTDNPAKADLAVEVSVAAREYNRLETGSNTLYFAYADAYISIDKKLVEKRVYEDNMSVKGGHTISYAEAAKAAFDKLAEKLGSIINQNI